jgi:hypothetical protein
MATVARATQVAIDAGDANTVRQHFAFIDEVFKDAAPDVENAVNVSYLENLKFDGRKIGLINARKLLSPRLQQALIELETNLEELFRRSSNDSTAT